MNFVLFCLTSKYFRGRLRVFAQQRINDLVGVSNDPNKHMFQLTKCGLATEKKYSMISNGRTHSMKMRMLRVRAVLAVETVIHGKLSELR